MAALAQAKTDLADALLARHPRPASGARWAEEARAAAATRLKGMGGPVRRDEYWKYTDPARLTAGETPAVTPFDAGEPAVFDAVERLKLVFVDGVLDTAKSDALALEGLEIETLTDALATDIHWAKDVFGVLEARGQNPVPRPLAALNTAMAGQGIAIRVTGKVETPVSILYLHEDASSDAVIHHVIRLDPGAEMTLLEAGPVAARTNQCLEVEIADGARFHHVRAQGRDHERRAATHVFARLGAGSVLKSFTLGVNGVLTRNEFVIEFTGDDAQAHVAGAAAGDGGDFHHDDTVFITHDAVNCESRQVFKKVLRNGAVGTFQGKILVKPGAQKTDGYQISQGLLLDDDSQFLAKPELEIYADDVACSHGSTVGALDEDGLFYLTSRGVPRHEAVDMLVLAFLDEAIQEIEDARLADEMRERLAGWLSRRRKG
ncbi:SufD family Fe-S cluster assembly protein [Halovulum dunhuangense]|uniref:SufD family Fe-S cluster assembly protein n=1 Tax=Halovulum dunhuangense TaxID=1505036 RepID=A0A849L3F2_9RHOB|nr:SufD family Fe-S cluster assembly protein [Halovulum dunhuangense]NNU80744.1 SufD family Fe-S cluster assembly protein [Halovulum dunhuangense]